MSDLPEFQELDKDLQDYVIQLEVSIEVLEFHFFCEFHVFYDFF